MKKKVKQADKPIGKEVKILLLGVLKKGYFSNEDWVLLCEKLGFDETIEVTLDIT
jgi:hypothetical protein